jgi:lipopolysaccharide export system permease protein
LYIQSRETFSKYRKNELSLEFWRKVLQPLVTFSLVILAMSFLFGPMREQKTGQRILIAIGVAFTVDLTQKLLGSISVVSEIPTIASVLFPALLIICISLVLLKRV